MPKGEVYTEQRVLAEPKVYPNPTRDNFIVKTSLKENEEIEIRVYDNVGRIVNVTKGVNEETNISLGNQPACIYYVRFLQNEKTYSYKVVKL
ncbi:MAG TPA: T9SS type A sorting domain-containing protein [Paludibacter sp.]|nr:T9SS type A sorting domain-containing protein [Paludibacter sp.]